MKLAAIIAGLSGFALILAFVGLMPASGNFVRYLYWQMTETGTVITGSVTSGDADIHYTVYGSGPPVVLLHGGLSHRLSWFSQLPWLVTSGRQVILIDTRGHGRSGLGKDTLSYHRFATDVVAVLNRLRIPCSDMIGWSDGANTALVLARDWPQRVGRLVLISGNFDPAGLTATAQADSRQLSSGPMAWLKALITGAGRQLHILETRIKALWLSGPVLTLDEMREIHHPALVIVGERDQITTTHARSMAALLSGSSLLIVPGGGHATPVSHAGEVNAAITEFFKRHPRQPCPRTTHAPADSR